MELLCLPEDGQPKLLLDLGCGSGLSGETLEEVCRERRQTDTFYLNLLLFLPFPNFCRSIHLVWALLDWF